MQRSKRVKTIINAVRVPGGARVADLAEATGASEMTIRRDLGELERQGVVRRTHGGAVSLPARGTRLPFAVRVDTHLDQKQAIAVTAARQVSDGSSVIIDAGTTCTAVAQALAGRDVTALALSVHVAGALGECPGARILTPGGPLDSDELTWIGHAAVRDVQDFRADLAILGVCAWDENGLTAASSHDAEMKRAVLRSSNRVIAVTTADKFNTSATFAVCPTDRIDTVITSHPVSRLDPWITASTVEILSG